MPTINKVTISPLWSRSAAHHSTRLRKKIAIYGIIILIITIFIIFQMSSLHIKLEKSQSETKSSNCQILHTASATQIAHLTTLSLKSCSLVDALPSTIRYATNLIQLDISDNPDLTSLTTSPADFQALQKLEILFSSSNTGFKELPPVLGTMNSITRLGWRDGSLAGELDADSIPPNLVHLILTNNNIDKVHGKKLFSRLKNVRKLMLSHNRITKFGTDVSSNGGWDSNRTYDHDYDDVSQMFNLELLRLAGNKLTSLPPTLWTLPKLTWLTISGNPITAKHATTTVRIVPQIDIKSLIDPPTVSNLGEGASGSVRTYLYEGNEVAVKIPHAVTSDGRAEDELAIYSILGDTGKNHHIVGCIGTLLDGGKEKGVLMERLPAGLEDLASPPTIVEVTKDRWVEDRDGEKFTPPFVKNVLLDLVEALVHLHGTVGVAHGDVYAHNMKVDRKTGHIYLLDFGASYIVGEYSLEAERLEVRAVGVLIGELADRLLDPWSFKNSLISLRESCLNVDVRKRPSLEELQKSLLQLKY